MATFLRILGVLVYLALAAPLLASVSDGPPSQRPLLGLMTAAFFLALVGTINWGISRARKNPRAWWHATLSVGPIVTTLMFVWLSFVGQQEARRESRDRVGRLSRVADRR